MVETQTRPRAAPGAEAEAPRVSVIIPHLNTPELLVRAIRSVATQQLDHGRAEIIVVDNGSRLSLEAVKAAWPDVRFLLEPTPGPGPARNLGIAHASADLLGFIDADVKAEPGWLQAGLDALAQDDHAPIGGDVRIDTGGRARLTGVEAFECVFSFDQKTYINRLHFSVTANMMMTRAVFEQAGPFGGIEMPEDKAFGEKAHSLGMTTRFVPEMRALHPARASMDEMRRKWARLSRQKLSAHLSAGHSLLRWRLLAVAVMLSGVAHAPRMLFSPRVSGAGNRLRGLTTLLHIRWARGLDMLNLARKAGTEGATTAMNWNR